MNFNTKLPESSKLVVTGCNNEVTTNQQEGRNGCNGFNRIERDIDEMRKKEGLVSRSCYKRYSVTTSRENGCNTTDNDLIQPKLNIKPKTLS